MFKRKKEKIEEQKNDSDDEDSEAEKKKIEEEDEYEIDREALMEHRINVTKEFIEEKHKKAHKVIDEHVKSKPKNVSENLFNYNQYFKKRYLEYNLNTLLLVTYD